MRFFVQTKRSRQWVDFSNGYDSADEAFQVRDYWARELEAGVAWRVVRRTEKVLDSPEQAV